MISLVVHSQDTTQVPYHMASSPNSFSQASILQDETLKSFMACRPPSVPVTGRRVPSGTQVLQNPDFESQPRFPIPVDFSKTKKLTSKDRPPIDINRTQRIRSTGKVLDKTRLPEKPVSGSKDVTLKPSQIKSKTSPTKLKIKKTKPIKINLNQLNKTDPITEAQNTNDMLSFMKDCPVIKENKQQNISQILSQSLKKQKHLKQQHIKEQQRAKEEQELRKERMQQQNLKVREKNLQKFRQDTFKPKVPWGIDERKINGVTEYEVRKNADEIRNRRRMERQRARSAGRGVIGLDGLDKLKEEFNIPVKKALHIHPPPVHPKKQQKKHDPKLKTFMKKKKKERKQANEDELIKIQSDEAKRLSQLKQLELQRRLDLENFKRKQHRGRSRGKIYIQEKFESESESEETDKYDSNQMFENFGEEFSVESQSWDQPVIDEIESYEPISLEAESPVQVLPSEILGQNIIDKRRELKLKLSELKNRMDQVKESETSSRFNTMDKDSAATLIQKKYRQWKAEQQSDRGQEQLLSGTSFTNESKPGMRFVFDSDESQESQNSPMIDTLSDESEYRDQDEEIQQVFLQNRSYQGDKDSKPQLFLTNDESDEEESPNSFQDYIDYRVKMLSDSNDSSFEQEQFSDRQVIISNRESTPSEHHIMLGEGLQFNISSTEQLLSDYEQSLNKEQKLMLNIYSPDQLNNSEKFLSQFNNSEKFLNYQSDEDNDFDNQLLLNISSTEHLESEEEIDTSFHPSPSFQISSARKLSSDLEESPESIKQESPKEVIKDSFEFTHSPILDRNNRPYAKTFEIREDVQDRIEKELLDFEDSCKEEDNQKLQLTQLLDFSAYSSFLHDNNNSGFDLSQNQLDELKESPKENSDDSLIVVKDDFQVIGSEDVKQIAEEVLMMLLAEDYIKTSQSRVASLPPLDFDQLGQSNPAFTIEYRIKTDTQGISEYIDEILQVQKQTINKFTKNLKTPISEDPMDVLQKMHEAGFGPHDILAAQEVLPLSLYLELESSREKSLQNDKSETYRSINEAEHIHNKMIFDCLNEALQCHRPYGIKGKPMPWSYNVRQLAKTTNLQQTLESVKNEVVIWSQAQVGKLPSKEVMTSNDMIDEEGLQMLREEKLANILANDILEKDEIWIDYEWEETQVCLDMADMCLESLVSEIFYILNSN